MPKVTISPQKSYGTVTIEPDNLTVTAGGNHTSVAYSSSPIVGKKYWEVAIHGAAYTTLLGVSVLATAGIALHTQASSLTYYGDSGNKYPANLSYGAVYGGGHIIGIAFDSDNRKITFYKNGVSQGIVDVPIPAGQDIYAVFSCYYSSKVTFNFGSQPFTYTIPTGYTRVDTITKYLIKSSNTVQTLSNDIWTDIGTVTPSALDFETFGLDILNTISSAKIEELIKPYSILTWTDNVNVSTSKFNYIYDKPATKFLEIATDPFIPIKQFDNISVLTYTDSADAFELKATVVDEYKIRYLISKDNKTTWYTFKNNQWVLVDIANISSLGMTKQEIEAISPINWSTWFTRGTLDFAIHMESNVADMPSVSSITVNFPENEAPFISATLTPDNVHNAWVELVATLTDLEGDKIQYQVHINGVQVYPTIQGEWSPELNSGHTIMKAYQYPDFVVGPNEVKLITQDSRLVEREWVGTVTVVNNDPYTVFTNTLFSLAVTIGDDDSDQIQYRILINGVQKYPAVGYSAFMDTPYSMTYEWDSADLNFGRLNTIKVEVEDSFGGQSDFQFQVIGSYKGYLFKNEFGEYLTSDKGDILKYITFPRLIAGNTTPPEKLTLVNQTDYNVSNTIISSDIGNLPANAQIEFSLSEDPFTPIDNIEIVEPLAMGDSKDFYIRINSQKGRGVSAGTFNIHASGKII